MWYSVSLSHAVMFSGQCLDYMVIMFSPIWTGLFIFYYLKNFRFCGVRLAYFLESEHINCLKMHFFNLENPVHYIYTFVCRMKFHYQ